MRTTTRDHHTEQHIDHDLWSWARESQIKALEVRPNKLNRNKFQRLWSNLSGSLKAKKRWTLE